MRAAVTAEVITVRNAMPLIITNAPITRPVPLLGTTSPYPTVVIVCSDHHNATPRVSKSLRSVSHARRPPASVTIAVKLEMITAARRGVSGLRRNMATSRPAAGAPGPGGPRT